VDVIVVSVIVSAAMFAALMWWTRVTGQREQARLQGRKFETGRHAAAQGWQVWEHPGGDTGDRPWSGLLAQRGRGLGHGWVTMAVEGSRSGHSVYGLWITRTDGEGDPYFDTTCGLLLTHAYQTELSVEQRHLRPLIRFAPHRGGLTGDAEFECRFRVRCDSHGTGWTAGELLTAELRAALLSGEAYPEWSLSGRYISVRKFGWMRADEFDAVVNALIVVIDRLPPSSDAAAASFGGPPDRGIKNKGSGLSG
jgi:hypothetical protein